MRTKNRARKTGHRQQGSQPSSQECVTNADGTSDQQHVGSNETDVIHRWPKFLGLEFDPAVWVCGLIGISLYINTLDAGFVYDDSRAIQNNPDIRQQASWSNLLKNDFWGTPLTHSGSHKSFRPLTVATFRLNYFFDALNPFGYHLVNVLAHGIATGLFTSMCRELMGKSLPTWAAGLTFALHPVHVEAVAGVVGRADIIACILFLLSFKSYRRHVGCRRATMVCGKPPMEYHECPSSSSVSRSSTPGLSSTDDTDGDWSSSSSTTSSLAPFSSESSASRSQRKRSSHVQLMMSMGYAALAMLAKEHGITVFGVCLVYEILVVSKLAPGDVIQLFLPIGGKCKRFTNSSFTKRKQRHQHLQYHQHVPHQDPSWEESWLQQGSPFKSSTRKTRHTEKAVESISVIVTSCALFLALRLYATGSKPPTFAAADNPASQADSLLTRTLTFWCLPVLNFGLLLWPKWLSYDWSMDAVPLVESLLDWRVFASLGFYGLLFGIFVICNRRFIDDFWNESLDFLNIPWTEHFSTIFKNNHRHRLGSSTRSGSHSSMPLPLNDQVTTALLLLIIPFLPATNAFFHVGFVIAERVLYIPSMGFAMLVGIGAELIARRRRKVALGLLVITLIAFSVKSLLRNRDWVDEKALYSSGIPINPAKSYSNLGQVLSATGRLQEAESAYQNAIKLRPNMADAHYNLGVLLQNQGRTQEAIDCYKIAIKCRPKLASAYLNLGQLYANSGQIEAAVEVWKKCAQLDSEGLKDPHAHEVATTAAVFQLGRLYADSGRYFDAIQSYETAIRRRPDSYQPQSIYNMLGEAHTKLGNYGEAERWYKMALEAKPDHVPAHLKYGRMLAKNRSRLMEAELHFLRAKRLAPEDTSVYFHFGQFLLESSRYDEAAVEYEKAAELAPGDVDAVLNAANALRQAGYNDKAEQFYRKAVQLKPDDPAIHMNLGAILHLNGKLLEAEQSYLRSLELRPRDETTLTNLERLYNLFKKHGIKRRHER